jgi:hypothetical protein
MCFDFSKEKCSPSFSFFTKCYPNILSIHICKSNVLRQKENMDLSVALGESGHYRSEMGICVASSTTSSAISCSINSTVAMSPNLEDVCSMSTA